MRKDIKLNVTLHTAALWDSLPPEKREEVTEIIERAVRVSAEQPGMTIDEFKQWLSDL